MATLRMSRRSRQSELKRWIHLTDRIAILWLGWSALLYQLTVDCGKVRQVRRAKWPIPASLLQQVAGCLNCTDGDPSLAGETLRSHIILQSSLANCHPVQCSPNMRVADCATVWDCKWLQLIYRRALHLTLKSCSRQTSRSTKSMVCRSLTIRLQERKHNKTNWMDRSMMDEL